MGINTNDPLLQADIPYIEQMLKDGILKLMNADLFPGRNGIQIIRCPDGDQVGHLMTTHRLICQGRDCHHSHSLNGLPIRFSPLSPLYNQRHHLDELICEDIVATCGLKDLKESIALYPHWPCGAGLTARLSIWEQMSIATNGKRLLLEYLAKHGHGNMVIVLGMHLDLFYKDQKTKVLLNWNRHQWANWHQAKFPHLDCSIELDKLVA